MEQIPNKLQPGPNSGNHTLNPSPRQWALSSPQPKLALSLATHLLQPTLREGPQDSQSNGRTCPVPGSQVRATVVSQALQEEGRDMQPGTNLGFDTTSSVRSCQAHTSPSHFPGTEGFTPGCEEDRASPASLVSELAWAKGTQRTGKGSVLWVEGQDQQARRNLQRQG